MRRSLYRKATEADVVRESLALPSFGAKVTLALLQAQAERLDREIMARRAEEAGKVKTPKPPKGAKRKKA